MHRGVAQFGAVDPIARSLALGPLTVEPLSELCAGCAHHRSHEPRGVWTALLTALHIQPSHGLFVDVGTSHDMADGSRALRRNFSVLAIEARKRAVTSVQRRFAHPIAAGQLTLLHAAVSATGNRTLIMQEAGDASFVEGLTVPGRVAARGRPGHVERVAMTTLDDVVGTRPCAVIKLDIQGAEFEALRGALRVLRRPNAPLVVFELYEGFRPDLPRLELLHLMRGLGYTCYDVSNGNGREAPPHGQPLVSRAQCAADYPGTLRRLGHPLKALLAASGLAPHGRLFGRLLQGWPPMGMGCRTVGTDFACVRDGVVPSRKVEQSR